MVRYVPMKARIFSKPHSAEPLPLEIWLRRTDRGESGREPFFRGRGVEYNVFRDAVLSLNDGVVGGGTVVFQGAPGSGKTALMAECMEAIRQHSTSHDPWVAVDIMPESLRSSVDVARLIIDSANQECERLSKLTSGILEKKLKGILKIGQSLYDSLSERGVGIAGFSVGGKRKGVRETVASAQNVFNEAAALLKDFHIVVFVDEAQNIHIDTSTQGVLHCLNVPPAEIPMLATFFGLSNTEDMLSKCGISRLAGGRVMNLDRLSHLETSDAMRSVFKAYGFTDSLEDQDIWVDRLAELSQGWPQHINRVAVAASLVVNSNGGKIRAELLDKVLEDSQEQMKNYYTSRLRVCSHNPSVYKEIAQAIGKTPNGILSYSKLQSITQSMLSRSLTTVA